MGLLSLKREHALIVRLRGEKSFATISSCYTSSWDLSVDWGLLRPRYAYLRESLGYPSIRHVSVPDFTFFDAEADEHDLIVQYYYVAMASEFPALPTMHPV
jgi:hypothetical protein